MGQNGKQEILCTVVQVGGGAVEFTADEDALDTTFLLPAEEAFERLAGPMLYRRGGMRVTLETVPEEEQAPRVAAPMNLERAREIALRLRKESDRRAGLNYANTMLDTGEVGEAGDALKYCADEIERLRALVAKKAAPTEEIS
jgi:hypothetical protein